MGMGGRYFVYNPETGLIDIAVASPESNDRVRFMRDFIQSPGLTWRGQTHITYTMDMFRDGRALFLAYMLGGPGEMREMEDDWGMLPTPKGSVSQPAFVNKIDHNAPLFGMTITNRDAEKAALIMESIGARFAPVRRMALNDLEDLFLRSDDCIEMVQYVDGYFGYDLALILQNANARIRVPFGLIFGATFGSGGDFAADMEAILPVLEYEVNTFMLNVELD
jgi:hypothetical protein